MLSNVSLIQSQRCFSLYTKFCNQQVYQRFSTFTHAIILHKDLSFVPWHQTGGMCLAIFMSNIQILKLALWRRKECFSSKTAKTCVKNTLKPDILIVAFYPKPSLANNWKIVSSLCSSWALIWWFVFKGWALLLRGGGCCWSNRVFKKTEYKCPVEMSIASFLGDPWQYFYLLAIAKMNLKSINSGLASELICMN